MTTPADSNLFLVGAAFLGAPDQYPYKAGSDGSIARYLLNWCLIADHSRMAERSARA